jgi:hypothetical protein
MPERVPPKRLDEVRRIKQEVEGDLLKRNGVVGVDVGYKYVGGERTGEIAIRVLVRKKKDVSGRQRIPRTIQGVKTDVIEREIELHRVPVEELELLADTGTYDPLKGGISIGPCRAIGGYVYVGTLGAIVRDNVTGNPMLLSNFHVMCVDNTWSVGNTMAQPSRVDGGTCPASVVGTLQRAVLGGQVDCAVSSHTARGHACEIVDIGAVAGTATATLGMPVRKRGRTTLLTYGEVDSIALTVSIDYGDGLGVVTLTNQIGIVVDTAQSTEFGKKGDSGSVVVDNSRRVVGLYFAGTPAGDFGVANPIAAVLSALNVSMCTGGIKKLEFDKPLRREKLLLKEVAKIEKIEVKEFVAEKTFRKDKPEKEIYEGKGFIREDFPIEPIEPILPPDVVQPVFPDAPIGPAGPFGAAGGGGSVEERLEALEAAAGLAPMHGEGEEDCAEFSGFTPGLHPSPLTVGPFTFRRHDHTGAPLPDNRVTTHGSAHTGLDCGFRLDVEVRPACPSVRLTLVHFATAAKVEAWNKDGTFAGAAAMSGPQNVVETLMITGTDIGRVVVTAPQDETLLLEICCGRKDKEEKEKREKEKPEKEKLEKLEKREKLEKPEKEKREKEKFEKLEKHEKLEKPEKFEKHEKLEKREKLEKPEKREKFEKPEKLEWEHGKTFETIQEPSQPGAAAPGGGGGSLEDRLSRLEAALGQLEHFIGPELRPDLTYGALSHEADLEGKDFGEHQQ